MNLRQVFDDLVRFETELWNGVDARLRREGGVALGTFNLLLVVQATANCRVQQIAEQLAITVGGASQAVDRIEQKGLCKRQQDSADGRSSIVSLTALGARKLAEATPLFDNELARWFDGAGKDGDLQQFATVLAELRNTVSRRDK